MQVHQKKRSTRTTFSFEDESLKYSIRSKSQRWSFSVNYSEISPDLSEYETQNRGYWHLGLVFFLIALVHISLEYQKSGSVMGSLWLLPALFCIVSHKFSKASYTILGTDHFNILIIQDTHHDEILQEILNRRRKLMMSWYGTIDRSNNPDEEIRRFTWLKRQKVISDAEFNRAMEEIDQNRKNNTGTNSGFENKRKNLH